MEKFDFLKYLTPRTIVNLSVMLGFLFFVIPILVSLSNEVSERAETLQEQRASIAASTHTVSRLAELRKASTEAAAAMAKLRNLVPPRDELFSFSKYLESRGFANNVGVTFGFTGQEKPAGADKAGSNVFRVTGEGGFVNTLKFLQDIESGQEFFISLESIDLFETKNVFSSTITGLVFFYD